MKILITGANGLLGTHCEQLLAPRHQVTGLSHHQLDICDEQSVRRIFRQVMPEAVINCAAITDVDLCERDPDLSRAINIDGPTILAEACARIDAQLVHFSSNYVFSGEQYDRVLYTVRDTPQPINCYGLSKWLGEQEVQARWHKSHIVRTSWIYGPQRDNFLGTIHRQLRAARRIKAIHDAWANSTFAPDLVARIEWLLEEHCYGLHHIANDGVCSRHEFAFEAARLIGMSNDEAQELIETVSEAEAGRPAPRPAWSPMAVSTTATADLNMPHWRDALRTHISAG